MNKFKVGDKVRRMHQNADDPKFGMYAGMTYVVREVTRHNDIYVEGVEGMWQRRFFELVEESKSELQELVDKANEGLRALNCLYNVHKNKIEINGVHTTDFKSLPYLEYAQSMRIIRIKSQIFKLYNTSNGYEVKVDGNKLYIGCQGFPLKWFTIKLGKMIAPDSDVHGVEIGEIKLVACRKGISSSGHTITWADAEKIYQVLLNLEGNKK